MTYQVLARKWRPQDFTDMVGQDHISSTLCNAIKNNRVGHAYLFVGTRGTGKTTTARIFAKAINCESPLPNSNPCNKCVNCVEITAGSSMDVLEIDGASNNGVDDIRRLRDNVQYTPARCQYKVYIIDEVHMLSTAAWNALLKTLEEPPEHVKFLFATTEVHKVLPTILSRCQRFDLKRISQGTISRRLQEVAQKENARFDSSALNSIARAANGGMRDALSIMDQMIAFCSEQEVISEHDVSEVFGLTSSHDLGKIMSAMLSDNAKQLINEINRLSDMGRNLEQLYSDLLKFCRNLMICAISGDNASDILDLDEYDLEMSRSIVSQSSADTIQKLMDGFLSYDGKLRHTLNKRVFMEMTLVRIMKDSHAVSLNDILARINHLRKTGSLNGLEGDIEVKAKQIELPEPQKKNDIIPPATQEENQKELAKEDPITEEAPASEPSAADTLNKLTDTPDSEVIPEVSQEVIPEVSQEAIPETNPEGISDTVQKVISETTQEIDSPAPVSEEAPLNNELDQNEVNLEPEPEKVKEESAEPLTVTPAQGEIQTPVQEPIQAPIQETIQDQIQIPVQDQIQVPVQAEAPTSEHLKPADSETLDTVAIDDSFELPYSTFIDSEYIDKARNQDPLNIGVKKVQGNFDENNETPSSTLGLFQTVSNTQSTQDITEEIKPEKVIDPAEQKSPANEDAINEISEAPVLEAVAELPVEEPIAETPVPEVPNTEVSENTEASTEVNEEKEEYIPQQAPAESSQAQQTAQDTLETISKEVLNKEIEPTPESEAQSFWKILINNSQSTQLKAIIQNITPVSYQENRFYAAYETGQAEIDEGAKLLLEGELRKATDNVAMELTLVGASKDVEDDKPVLTSGEDVWNRVQGNPFFSDICKEFDGKIIDVRG